MSVAGELGGDLGAGLTTTAQDEGNDDDRQQRDADEHRGHRRDLWPDDAAGEPEDVVREGRLTGRADEARGDDVVEAQREGEHAAGQYRRQYKRKGDLEERARRRGEQISGGLLETRIESGD